MIDNAAIWKTNPNNSWRLYSHTDYKPPEIQESSKEQKEKKNASTQAKSQTSTAFSFTKSKPATKGSIACTSKGYGIIQAFNEEKGVTSVKIEGQVHELSQEEVFNDIPLNVVFLNNSMRMEEVIYLPISSTMNDLMDRLESSLDNSDGSCAVSLYSNGKEIAGSSETLEKLKILPWSKYLGIVTMKKPLTVKRYVSSSSGWSIGQSNQLGMCFTPSKTIKVIGFAMYRPQQGTLTGTASFYHGSFPKPGEDLGSKSVTITESATADDLEKIMFKKPFTVNAGESGSVMFVVNNQSMCHYGNGGKAVTEGEGGVSFTFKVCDGLPYLYGIDSGPIPEIYYYA